MYWARQKELAQYNISSRQAYVLFVLYNLGGKATLGELAQHANRGVSTLSQQLTRLETDGLVTKNRENPRSVLKKFELTEKGIKVQKNVNKRLSDQKIMSVLSNAERKQLILILLKIKNEAEKWHIKPSPTRWFK